VLVVAELLPFSGGLKRNIVQCLDDFGIPLKLSHTVVNIEGKNRVEAVTIAKVDENRNPIPGTELRYECDTLLLSCGLIPENELSRSAGVALSPVTGGPVVTDTLETSVPGIFAAGNVLHVHDLVDYVSEEAKRAGQQAAAWSKHHAEEPVQVPVQTDKAIRYTVPATVCPRHCAEDITIRFRVGSVMKKTTVSLYLDDEKVAGRKRPVMAPGEMEQITIPADALSRHGDLKSLRITVEEA